MKIVASLRGTHGSHSDQHIRNLVEALDGTTTLRNLPVPPDTDLLVQWGFKPTVALRSAIQLDIPYVIVDLGYFDVTRYASFSISINGLHGLSMPPVKLVGGNRPHPKVETEREVLGDQVVIVGQMPNDQSLFGADIDAWMGRAADSAVRVYGKRVVKRPHPRMLNPWEHSLPPIEDTYDNTLLYVTYTSTTAIQTLCAGLPTHCDHPGSMGFDLAPRFDDDRDAWINEIAHRQFDFGDRKEIALAAKYILSNYEAARDADKLQR